MRIFLSGGMTGLSLEEMSCWRNFIKEQFEWIGNVSVISPPDYFYPTDVPNKEMDIDSFHFDLHWLEKSDVIIVNMNKLDSIGTAQEVMLAYIMNKPIFIIVKKDDYDKIHPWYKQEATKFFIWENESNYLDVLSDVVDYVKTYYCI